MSTISSAAKALVLAVLCVALFAPGLARLPPIDRDEARYVQATRQMLETGDLVDIRFQSEPRHKKPVGIYWLQAASVALLDRAGGKAVWPYRIPSLLGAVAAVLLTAWTGARLFSVNAGLIAGVLLASSLLLNVEARLATTDAALLACIVAAHAVLAGAHRSNGGVSHLQDLVFWGALGVGVLIKGPVAPLVCGVTILALVAIERRIAWLAPLRSMRGLGLFLAITVPWLAAIAYTSEGSFFAASIGHDFLGKLLVGQESHGAPPGTYLLSSVVSFWPASLVAGLALPWVWGNRRRPEVRFCLAWIVPAWIMCELIATKLPHYVLPTYPAIALLAGAAVAEGGTVASIESRPRLMRVVLIVWLVVSAALVLGVAALPIILEKRLDWIAAAACVVVAVCAWAVSVLLRARRHLAMTAILAGVALAFHVLAVGYVLPRVESLWVSRRVADLVAQTRPCPDSIVAAAGYQEPSLVFLLGTATRLVGPRLAAEHLLADPACALALIPQEDEAAFLQVLAESGATASSLGRVGGINYSKGRRVELRLFAIEARRSERFRQGVYRVHVARAGEDRRHRALLPRLQPLADALRRADQRDLVGELVGHRGGRLGALAGEEEVLDLVDRLAVAHAARPGSAWKFCCRAPMPPM